MEQAAKTTAGRKKARSQTKIGLVLAVAFMIACAVAFLKLYSAYIDEILYAERLNQMREVTTQLFSGLEAVINGEWRAVESQKRSLIRANPQTWDELYAFMEEQAYDSDLESVRSNIVAVDTDGAYYTQKGRQGLLPERDYINGDPKRISYVTNSLVSDESRMVFLQRLDNPITIQDADGDITICYYGISQNMEQLNPYFECEAYGGSNSVYVIDSDGLKLFSSSSGDLLKGYNVYSVLRNMEYLHNTTFDDARAELNETGLSYSNALLDKTELYYALYKMDSAAWTLIFLVPSQYVAVKTVDLVNTTIRMILVFAIIMLVVCVVLVSWIQRTQQKKELRIAAENNALLEANNKKLAQAQAATAEALQAAEAASKAKTDFLSNMSHDIRTPMNAIIGLTTLMGTEPGLSDKMRSYITKLEGSGHHLLELINNVLDMNRIESGKTTLNVTNINLAEQITQTETIIGAQANQKNQTLTLLTSHLNHEHVIADPARLQQILVNLLSNSVKYTPKGGHILFEIEERPRDEHYARYKFIVQDDGIGMSEEFMQHIFEPFSRAENTTTSKVQGSGLGMAITKTVVELMGGVIDVTSTPGKGSRFEVTLEFPIDTEADKNVQHLSVLLVYARNQDGYQRVQDAAAGKPIHLQRTQTLAEAAAALQQASFDVVLMPLHTPENEVEQLRKLAGSTTILLGAAESQKTSAVAAAGLDGVLPYPFFLSTLENEVQRVQQVRTEASQKENVSPLCGMKFLCAEDNEINSEILQMLLETKGASCTICRNGQEIVDMFATVKPGDYDMILMDVQMPVMDGLEATKQIRAGENPLGKTIPILAMTANAFLEDRQKSKEAGMDEHLSKPVDIKILEQTVRRFRLTPPRKNK